MKKRISLFVVVAVLAMMFSTMSAFAATTSQVEAALSSGVPLANGTVYYLSASQVTQAVTDITNANLTAAELDQILADIVQAKAIITASGVTSLANLSASDQAAIAALGDHAAGIANVAFVIPAAGAAGGTYATPVSRGQTIVSGGPGTTTTAGPSSANPLAQTGADYTIFSVMAIALLAMFAAAFAVARRKQLFMTAR